MDHQLAEKSRSLPPKCQPIPVILDVTLKRNFTSELFQRLAQMHLIQLSNFLNSRYKLQSNLHNRQLVVEYDRTLFGIMVQVPNQTDTESKNIRKKVVYQQASVEALYERLKNVGSRHPCWWGAERLVHLWIATSYLQSTFPEIVADLLLAVILDGSVEICTDEKSNKSLITELLPPSSLESTFVRFLYHLSFTDFGKTVYILDKSECHNALSTIKSFGTAKRNEFPPITIITPHDLMFSGFTKCLSDQGALRRIVNCARHSLQAVLKAASNVSLSPIRFDELFKNLPNICLESYDAIIYLKPINILYQTKENAVDNSVTGDIGFSTLATFDVVQTLLLELESAFQMEDNVMFHYNPEAHNIGVKLLKTITNADTLDLKNLMEDIKIIGKGLVSDVEMVKSCGIEMVID